MSFAPIVPLGGFAGWAFLKRTMGAQQSAFNKSAEVARDDAYFRANIARVSTAEELVSDRRLLKVALGAYGLEGDINNKFFIRKVLQDGTLDVGDLANRLANKQYAAMSSTFGFGDFATPATRISDFPDKILAAYKARQFEAAVGEQNNDMRLAMNAGRELPVISGKSSSEDTKWFTVMGNAPLRQVFEKALGLPSSFGALGLDQQLSTLRSKTEAVFGESTVSQFADAEKVDVLVRRYLVRSQAQANAFATSGSAIALQLLSR